MASSLSLFVSPYAPLSSIQLEDTPRIGPLDCTVQRGHTVPSLRFPTVEMAVPRLYRLYAPRRELAPQSKRLASESGRASCLLGRAVVHDLAVARISVTAVS